jgi:uncharacterized protein YunC (DUF1805 family)
VEKGLQIMHEHLDIARLDAIGVSRLKAELVDAVLKVSGKVSNGRTVETVLMHLVTEVGELAQEVVVAEGRSYKAPGRDGVVGEAVDVILCAVDLAWMASGRDADAVRVAMAAPSGRAPMRTPDAQVLSLLGPLASAGRPSAGAGDPFAHAHESLIVDGALAILASDVPSVTARDVLVIAERKLEKWRKTAHILKS